MVSIQEVAEQLGVSTHALRYYEKEGLIAVPRDAHGTRIFDEESISAARFIATCRQAGMSLADIRTILSNPDDHALSIDVMERARQKIEDEIVGLQQNLEHLDRRIQEHRRHLDSTRSVTSLLQTCINARYSQRWEYRAFFCAQLACSATHP